MIVIVGEMMFTPVEVASHDFRTRIDIDFYTSIHGPSSPITVHVAQKRIE